MSRGAGWRRFAERRLLGDLGGRLVERLARGGPLARVARMIEREHTDPRLDLETAARRAAIDKNHLNVRLRRAVGLTFHQILIRRRLLTAVRLLVETDHGLLSIARRCGFGSLRTLERNFRRHLGLPPGRFRRAAGEAITITVRPSEISDDYGLIPRAIVKSKLQQRSTTEINDGDQLTEINRSIPGGRPAAAVASNRCTTETEKERS